MTVYGRTPVSFGGVALQTAARKVVFDPEHRILSAPRYEAVRAERIGAFPAFSRMQPPDGKPFPLTIYLSQPTEGELRTLMDLFDGAAGPQTFVVADADGVQRQVSCASLGLVRGEAPTIWIAPLWAARPILLRAVPDTPITIANITASGATFAPTNAGDADTYPAWTIKPQAKKSLNDGWAYFRRIMFANASQQPLSDPASRGGLGKGYLARLISGWNTDAIIRSTVTTTTLSVAVTAGSTSFTLADASGLPNSGLIYVEPEGANSLEQVRYSSKAGNVLTVDTGGRGVGGTTAGAHGIGAVVRKSEMLADGRDIAVFVSGAQVPAEAVLLGGIKTTSTRVWIPLEHPAKLAGVLDAAMDASQTTLTLRDGVGDFPTPPFRAYAGTEAMRVTAKDAALRRLTVQRGVDNTTAAGHSVGDSVFHKPFDIRVAYGWGKAPARPTNPNPVLFDEATSDNATWHWMAAPFWADGNERPGGWVRELTGDNLFAVLVALDASGANARFADSPPGAAAPNFDTLTFEAPCGIVDDGPNPALQYDATIGWPFVLEILAVDLLGIPQVLSRRLGHETGAYHKPSAVYADRAENSTKVFSKISLRARQAVVTGAKTDDVAEALQTESAAGVDAQTFTLDKDTDLGVKDGGLVIRVRKTSGVGTIRLKVYTDVGLAIATVKEVLTPTGWEITNSDLAAATFENWCLFPTFATRTVLPAGKYSLKVFTPSAITAAWARNAQPLYPKGSHYSYNGATWDEVPAEDMWFAILSATADNQPEAPSGTGETLLVGDVSLRFDPTRIPIVDARPAEDAYYIESDITRTAPTAQAALKVRHLQKYTGALQLDIEADAKTVIDSEYGDAVAVAVQPGDKAQWSTIAPGANSISYAPVGAADEDVTLAWRSAWQA